jgi:hypothetical protein
VDLVAGRIARLLSEEEPCEPVCEPAEELVIASLADRTVEVFVSAPFDELRRADTLLALFD